MNEIVEHIKNFPNESPPLHICNASSKLMDTLGYAKGNDR
jgi:replication-associated recombination protein RarA